MAKHRIVPALILALTATTVVFGAAAAQHDNPRQQRRTPVVEVFEACRDAVVNISSKEIVSVRSPFDGLFEDFFDTRAPRFGPRTRQYTRTSVGSGFVIHPDGYIVTNAHVIAQTAERRVTFADGREFNAEVIAADSARDLAVLKVKADKPLPALRLGRSNDLMIGETVITIGNPLGLQHTVTAGVVSATDRDLEISSDMSLRGLIQTDASINPGNSGGPLLNALGELIGVNSAIRGDAQNIGFAIPVDQLRELLPDLLDVERRYRIICGMTVGTLDEPNVLTVIDDSPAALAGVQAGDILKAINGKPVHEGVEFCIALINRKPGDVLQLQLERNGMAAEATVTLSPRPAPNGRELASQRFGIELEDLPDDVAGDLGLEPGAGLAIVNVERGSPAEAIGLRRRDVLIALGRHYITSLDDLGDLLEKLQEGQSVPITILRVERGGLFKWTGPLQARGVRGER